MDLLLQRQSVIGDALPGLFDLGGVFFAFALERVSLAIPTGRYRVLFTVSARASRGELWSPDPQHRLSLIDGVPGRSGIRIHAGNDAEELLGCVALGQQRNGAQLANSRAALIPFVEKVAAADALREWIWITIQDAL